ncbi:MAG TPA: hypothetical protein VF041_11355 [Gemmatimonadaceae bacterium]
MSNRTDASSSQAVGRRNNTSRSIRYAVGITMLALLVAACSDRAPLTAPRAAAPPSPSVSSGDPPEPSNVFHVDLVAATSADNVGPIDFAQYSRRTLVQVSISGTYEMIWNVGGGYGTSAGTTDPGGWWSYLYYDCMGNAWVRFASGGYEACRTPSNNGPWIDTIVVQGIGQAGKYPGPHASNYYCDTGDFPACYRFAGLGFRVTIQPIATDISVSAEQADGLSGRTVTFTVTGADTVQRWEFVPDDGAIMADRVGPGSQAPGRVSLDRASSGGLGTRGSTARVVVGDSRALLTDTPECIGSTAKTCVETVTQSGTMYVLATVAGVDQQASVHVSVQPDTLLLRASPTWGYAGTTITFTPSTALGSPFQVDHWTWIPDVAPGATLSCPNGDIVCTVAVQETGTMRVFAVVEGKLQSADARVRIVKCPQGDSMLDNPANRDSLRNRWAMSNASGPDSLRLERPSVTFRRPSDGDYITIPVDWPGETPCSNPLSQHPLPAAPPGYVLDSWQHSHPFSPGEMLPENCFPGDTLRYRYSTRHGGPSPNDWGISVGVAPFNTVPGYIQDKKNIYKFLPGIADSTKWNSKNVRRWKRKFLDDPNCQ